MQLDLLYSFFIVCMDRHKKIQVTNTQIYVCVFIQHEGKGSDWHYMATQGEVAEVPGVHCLSKTTAQSPVSASYSGHTFKKNNTRNRTKPKG